MQHCHQHIHARVIAGEWALLLYRCGRGQLCMAGGGSQAVMGSRAAGCGSEHEQVPAGCCQAHQAGQPAAICTPAQLDSQMASSNQVCIASHLCAHLKGGLFICPAKPPEAWPSPLLHVHALLHPCLHVSGALSPSVPLSQLSVGPSDAPQRHQFQKCQEHWQTCATAWACTSAFAAQALPVVSSLHL